ncbi:hypothetical protein ABT093_09615 [Kitasatospora sp. NPDC002551]|uniref:hypothetical protein n=1 Tax=Kitasatospora sp. NPDC002551 TaxID=3154539 RepID=UPI0033295143
MPDLPGDWSEVLRSLDARLRAVEGRSQIRPAMTRIEAGDVTVGTGGTFKVNNALGAPQFYVGGIGPLNPDGSPQRGLLVYRQDGSKAITINNMTTNPADPQGLVLRDADANTLLAEDVVGGGLSAPIFGADAWYGYTEVPQWTTSSASFATCMSLKWHKHHPRVESHFLARCSDGTTAGEIRLVDGSGGVIGQVTLAPGDYFVSYLVGPITGAHLGFQTLEWQARRTAGAGTVGVKGLSTFGVGS